MRRKIVILLVIFLALATSSSASAKILVLDSPTPILLEELQGKDYEVFLPKDFVNSWGDKVKQIKIEEKEYFEKFEAIYLSEGVYNELQQSDVYVDIVSRDPFKTVVKARPDNGIVSQKTKVYIQRAYGRGIPLYGFSDKTLAIVTYSDDKVYKNRLTQTGIDHPRETVIYSKIIEYKPCSGLPVWRICWDYTQKR